MASRVRTENAFEEKYVSAFVDSCVNFESNVEIVEQAQFGSKVLYIAQESVGSDTLFADHPLSSLLSFARKQAKAGSPYAVSAEVDGELKRFYIGRLPTEASRHNCQLRPDVMIDMVKTVVSELGPDEILDVIVHTEQDCWDLAIASAVAKGSNVRFSAKRGSSETNFSPKNKVAVRCFIEKRKAAVKDLNAVMKYVQLCTRLVDAPPNLLDTTSYAEIAAKHAARLGCDFNEIRGEDLRNQGYGGIYGVGKAAEFPPALVHLTYKGTAAGKAENTAKKICLVGKGIIFDTGGLSLKPTTGMCGMKCDMGGSAAVFCGFLLNVELMASQELHCILCLADNAMGPRSTRNDDILLLKSGRTVEVNNTDAEGRLVLADGVFHAAALTGDQPDVVIDMATLTGAQGISTGKNHAAVFTNSDEWESKMTVDGKKCGDMTFPILYCPEFHSPEFSSKVADCRNSVRNRSNAQSSCAGNFIAENLPKDFKGAYVHIDMAAPAFINEAATGYGPTLLAQIISANKF